MVTRIHIDATIALSHAVEAKLKDAHVQFAYVTVSPHFESWHEIEALLLHSYLDDASLRKMTACKYIGIRAVRTDYVNGELAASMGIKVEGVRTQHGVNAVAEHTFALIFGLAKNLIDSDANTKSGKWRAGLGPNFELRGKILGIIGYGKIGTRVAEIGQALGMKILISGRGHTENEVGVNELLENSDIISLHLSGTETNRNFLDAERIAMIKNGAVLINTTRGLVADYGALEKAVASGKLSGLGLDVFPEEPLGIHSICENRNVICTPHLAFNTKEALENLNAEAVENVLRAVAASLP